jgi:hypothetical protein
MMPTAPTAKASFPMKLRNQQIQVEAVIDHLSSEGAKFHVSIADEKGNPIHWQLTRAELASIFREAVKVKRGN